MIISESIMVSIRGFGQGVVGTMFLVISGVNGNSLDVSPFGLAPGCVGFRER